MKREELVGEETHQIKEIDIMLKLHNPHLIHIHEVIIHPKEDYVYVILHYYSGGSLKNFIENTK